MPERTLHAIVLKRRDSGESDRRVTLLTQEEGVMDVVARGAKKSASRLSAASEPLAACIVQIAAGRSNSYLVQVQPVSSFPGLRTDYDRLTFAMAFAELAAAVLPHGQEAQEAFTIVVSGLRYLESHPKPAVALVWCELKLMDISGFMPSWASCCLTGGAICEARPWLSPHAGGYVAQEKSASFTDRFQARAEVLYGLAATAETDEPPPNLKLAEEALLALYPFWTAIAEWPLKANQSLVQRLREAYSL